VSFETVDAMGANFINSCLEAMKKALNQFASCDSEMDASLMDINMAILSNYTPHCKAVASVSCPVDALNSYGKNLGTNNLAERMVQAVQIAQINVDRAVTHNKGIYNGIDALAIATGNDWRALEAGGHAYAARNGKYTSLSTAKIENSIFSMELELPLAVGTVGGITNLHPMSKLAMEILGNPNATELMQLMVVTGLASNFSALLALTSTGIQKGHMKMHLSNILLQLKASSEQIIQAEYFFKDKTVSFSDVEKFLSTT
jgi:hydroxymethylglutaryl-CoA reductase